MHALPISWPGVYYEEYIQLGVASTLSQSNNVKYGRGKTAARIDDDVLAWKENSEDCKTRSS